MKKIFVFLFCTVLFTGKSFAQSPSPSPRLSVGYILPYPGILPDNILYKFKMVRDRIGAELISDSLRKAEYFLKMGDKRIAAAKFLSDYGNSNLAATTASKADIYLLRSVESAEKAKNTGKVVKDFLGVLSTASLKHDEYLRDMMGRAPDGPRQSFEKSLIVNGDVYKKVQELNK